MARRRRPSNVAAVALWPGAGASSDHPTLVAIEQALAAAGRPLPVFRCDFPYRLAGRRAPDRAPVLVASIRSEVERICAEVGVGPEQVVLGGRSMGVAEGLPAAGLVLVAYPLHPPGKPDRLRVEHFDRLRAPSLWLCGDADPFGTPEELAGALEAVPGAVTSVTLRGNHALKGRDDDVVAALSDWLAVGRPRPAGDPRAGDPSAGDPSAGDPSAGDRRAGR
jgi:predicted alpha/beta-hydrolase family hydrolase